MQTSQDQATNTLSLSTIINDFLATTRISLDELPFTLSPDNCSSLGLFYEK